VWGDPVPGADAARPNTFGPSGLSGNRRSPEGHYSQARIPIDRDATSKKGLTGRGGNSIMEGVEIGNEIWVWAGRDGIVDYIPHAKTRRREENHWTGFTG
jgi:hypothetical protein